jgi:hypothetical protein
MKIRVNYVLEIYGRELEIAKEEVIEQIKEDIKEDYDDWIKEMKVEEID